MSERVLSMAEGLSQLSVRLDRAAAITAGAHVCAERGAGQEAFQMILELDLDVLLRESLTLLSMICMRPLERELAAS